MNTDLTTMLHQAVGLELLGQTFIVAGTIAAALLVLAARRLAARRGTGGAVRSVHPPADPDPPQRRAFGGPSLREEFAMLRDDLAKELRCIRAELDKTRSAAVLRTRVASHQDSIYEVLEQVGSVADAVGRPEWIESKSLVDTERTVYANLRAVRIHLRALNLLNPDGYTVPNAVLSAIDEVWIQWGELTTQLLRGDPRSRDTHVNEREFSDSDYVQRWLNFYGAVGQLEDLLLTLPAPQITHRSRPIYPLPRVGASTG